MVKDNFATVKKDDSKAIKELLCGVDDMQNKSAKDIAFERERTKLQRQKREAEERLRDKDITIKSLTDKISELENIIRQKDEWIERLLEYTELTKEDLKVMTKKDKATAEAIKKFNSLMDLCERLY